MNLEIVRGIPRIRDLVTEARLQRRSIGCVPTMGALHAGHGALIEKARASSDVVVVTIFVNPLQFDRSDDYQRYARQLEADRAFCEARNVDIIFAPSSAEMYPEPTATFVDVPELAVHLCAAFRPGHFRGVATVVAKLFNIIQPDTAYFGEKDAQQLAIIQRLVHDLNFPIQIVPVATVRELDGLAMSSRNQRLTPEERQMAAIIFRALRHGRSLASSGEQNAENLKNQVLSILQSETGIRVEYLEIVNQSMQPVERISPGVRLVTAVWIGNTRLIDNLPMR